MLATQLQEFKRRRRQLMRSMEAGSIAVLKSAGEVTRSHDTYHPFRQDSSFYYMTGFNEPDAVLVLVPGRQQGEFILFCRDRDPKKEMWDGRREGPEGVVANYGADDAFPIDDIDDILPGLLEDRDRLFYTMGQDANFDKVLLNWVNQVKANSRKGVHAPNEIISLEYLLHEMRLVKTRAELITMRKAAKISCQAHERAMRACRPGMYEYELEAELLYVFNQHHSPPAYTSIVGGGANANVLHYIENNAPLQDGDLVLIDAACEYENYASDITRTYPVNGQFTEAQRELYEVVLESQLAAINMAEEGNHWNDPHDAAVKVLTKGLIEVGILKGKLTQLIKDKAYQPFYMHRTGHWLGIDVHDVGDYKIDQEWRLLENGMCMTIEPGLYIRPTRGVPKRFHNIGIRIEDDVAVTVKGPEVLTGSLAKTVDEIETLMAST